MTKLVSIMIALFMSSVALANDPAPAAAEGAVTEAPKASVAPVAKKKKKGRAGAAKAAKDAAAAATTEAAPPAAEAPKH